MSTVLRLEERPPIIAAVVRRHIEDAAFYWSQLDGSIDSPQLGAERASQFAVLLTAHLEGIRAGREAAATMALQALERWRKPGEAFVACVAALSLEGEGRLAAIEAAFGQVRLRPDLLVRGAVSALAWASPTAARRWLTTVTDLSDPVDLVVALRGSSLIRGAVADLGRLVVHASPHVRAAACRCADAGMTPALERLGADDDLAVRAESCIALARLLRVEASDHRRVAASRLWQCVAEQVAHREGTSGWDRVQADRRLNRWIRHLAQLAPVGHPGMRELVQRLPARVGLTAMLHHGDVGLLDLVVHRMGDDEQARWAGWVWHCLTGVDLLAEGLVLDEPLLDLDAPMTMARRDADLGLVLPDPVRVAAHPMNKLQLGDGHRVLLGRPAGESELKRILDPRADLPQGLRFVAANGLNRIQPELELNIRARPDVQRSTLHSLGIC
jgi:hypothetical protein